jgi:dihydrofolate reductase
MEIHGYAIVSRDDRIADASGGMPATLHNEADWAYFQAGLDLADWVALGRASHEAAPNARSRRRLILSSSARGLEARADGWWWNPDAIGFAEVLGWLKPPGGRLAVPGGRDVFELFLELGYAAFHLARVESLALPGGRGIFAGEESADVRLRRAGLVAGPTRWLDEPARVSLTVYKAG